VVSVPPPNLAAAVAAWGHRVGVPVLVDVQDLWPEAFARLWPPGLKWLNAVAGYTMWRDVRTAYGLSAAGLAVAEGYANHYRMVAGRDKACTTLHLGTNLAEFDRHIGPVESLRPLVGDLMGKRWLFVGGSLGSTLDWGYMIEIAARLQQRWREDLHILIAGRGPCESWIRRQVERRGLRNIRLLGQQPYAMFCMLAAASDFGFDNFRADSYVYFPNRVFDYFAADLLILNTVPGELADLIADHDIGYNALTFDVEGTVRYIESLFQSRPPMETRRPPRERRGAWVNAFDRPTIASRLPEILAGVVRDHRKRAS
jgi:hypothetical protein